MADANIGTMSSKLPVPVRFASWPDYWMAQGMPWRTEPQIDTERQHYLTRRLAVQPDFERGIYPFRAEHGSIKLDRADVEWLLATHESNGMHVPVDWVDESQRSRRGLNIRGADLREANLHDLPLAGTIGGLYAAEQATLTAEQLSIVRGSTGQRELAAVHLERANLHRAHLEGANLAYADMSEAIIVEAHLESAVIAYAHLERALLFDAHMQGALLYGAHLEGADLERAYFDDATVLTEASLSGASLTDVHWRGVNLTGVDWARVKKPDTGRVGSARPRSQGQRREGRAAKLANYRTLSRTYRPLATVLDEQGMDKDAARFSYLALRYQRKVLWNEGRDREQRRAGVRLRDVSIRDPQLLQ